MRAKNSDGTGLEQFSQLIGEQQFGEALNILNELEDSEQFQEAKILRIQLENILQYKHLDIFANTNLFMDPWFDE